MSHALHHHHLCHIQKVEAELKVPHQATAQPPVSSALGAGGKVVGGVGGGGGGQVALQRATDILEQCSPDLSWHARYTAGPQTCNRQLPNHSGAHLDDGTVRRRYGLQSVRQPADQPAHHRALHSCHQRGREGGRHRQPEPPIAGRADAVDHAGEVANKHLRGSRLQQPYCGERPCSLLTYH